MSAIFRRRHASHRVRLTALGLAVACSLGVATPSVAAPGVSPSLSAAAPGTTDPNQAKKQVDKEIEALKGALEDTSSNLKDAYIALRRTQAALPVAQAALDSAIAAVSKADTYNDEMAVQLDVARANEARAVDELTATRSKLAQSRTRVARFASQLYQDQGMGQLSVALSATTPDDFANRIAMNDTLMDVQNQSLSRLATARATATAQEAHIKALQVQVEAAKKQAEAALAKAQQARAAAAAAKQALDVLAAQQVAQSTNLAAQMKAEQAQLDAAQKEQARLQSVLIARARAAKAAAAARAAALRRAGQRVPPQITSSSGFLSRPSDGWISSEFGMRYHPILHYWRLHAGRDFAADCGTPIRAAASGTIISAGWTGGYGNRIMIDHGIVRGVDLVTTYNHMSRYVVQSGSVSRGEIIGYVGTSGESTGCHLHFETYEDGIPRDPRRWL
ncbi:murein DD-endopeptidase MepM/ murein hydrolase activator NlpD [Phycicoccus badiiscoriae]|uniref:Murein DD-endopeptidase MepM/ murein hydrolase activator NlpD n=1 Tax=Pedococcus badiiscoriae TaxID=642776 RepID=A0A852WRQ1_9MICO|nr:M23 family metallopeptidase [Pedococcus badiiscoriae]NYG07882.1 murein DD-endopeptidase MepM/ murein hydrolase activator NlpD [Pedococcus badiiscoriae]